VLTLVKRTGTVGKSHAIFRTIMILARDMGSDAVAEC
jgi:hypothetical protein